MTQSIHHEHSDASGGNQRLRQSIESNRQRLLDLGLRNNLLNYRLLKARGVEVFGVNADEIFQALVVDGRQMRFEAIEESSIAQLESGSGPEARSGRRRMILPVRSSEDELQKRLLNTHDSTRTAMEEQGVNTLFLAFGMLHWYEDANSNIRRQAPLILVPVELQRKDATAGFSLRYSGEEVGTNLSLEAKLSSEFRITPPPFDPEEHAVSDYVRELESAISTQRRWEVEGDRVVLGQFSFNKFLMYNDLDLDKWPQHSHPLEHPVLTGLLSPDGFNHQPSSYGDDQFLDDVVNDDDHPMIVDADSSQTLALLDVMDGRSMVIQGPPGTGKSQTITNLIALAIGQGKKVLFVAEKMAALEVVKRRLDELGLGAACLELHGTKTRKRRVLDDLSETLGLGEPRLPRSMDDLLRLGKNREWLNEYCGALGTESGETGVTTYEALGHVVKTRADHPVDEWPSISLAGVAEWDRETYQQRESIVRDLQSARGQVGDPRGHPLRGIRRSQLTPVEQDTVRTSLDQTIKAYETLNDLNVRLWEMLSVEPKDSPAAVSTAIETGKRARTATAQGKIQYAHPAWRERAEEISSLVLDGARLAGLWDKNRQLVTEDAWDADLDSALDELQNLRTSPIRHLRWTYWKNKRALDQYLTTDAPDVFDDRFEIMREVRDAQRLRESVEARDALGREMFAQRWSGPESDWDVLSDLVESAMSLQADIVEHGLSSSLPVALDDGVDRDELANLADSLSDAREQFETLRDSLLDELEFEFGERDGSHSTVSEQPLSTQRELLDEWRANFAKLSAWVAFRRALRNCVAEGMESLAEVAWRWERAGDLLLELFHYRRSLEIVDHAWKSYPVLGAVGVEDKQKRVEEFVRLDQRQLSWNQAVLAKRHWQQLPDSGGGGELRVLTTEIQKKRRNLPIRQLISKAGNAIQAIKPVFMMSPLSIANFIPPGSIEFDLIVFDEASQVAPVDAFGAIVRGRQTVVVGDDRQLPPTQFFDKTIEQDEEFDEEEFVSTQDLQSILNLFLAQHAPQRMLRWHYRSQHDSLIAVSNNEFYGNKLVIFPSPTRDGEDLGLRFRHLPDAVYDRGGSKTNREEARQVAEAVMAHAHETPELTLGVAAFSISQAEAVRDHLEMLRRANPSVESFFAAHEAEPFFVKNLENVQGDERDVIFISVGYGRDQEGRMNMNFGPLTKDGGERRLNVLITRARRRCEIFSSITDEDISANASSRGVQALRTFLHFARTNQFPETTTVGGDVESPFEEAVRDALERQGYEVHCQVGTAGYFIDLAVVDPDYPGRYLIAIECDGATYHSARSSRDRDRLRQQVLERLGWTVYRIWSTDWFADPDAELERLIMAIENARGQTGTVPLVRVDDETREQIDRQNNGREVVPNGPEPLPDYQFADISLPQVENGLDQIPDWQLADSIQEVVRVEGPIHLTILYRRVTSAAGLKRSGQRIKSRIDAIVEQLDREQSVTVDGEFIWPASDGAPPFRSRLGLDQSERKLEVVAPREIDQVILRVVQRSFSITPDEAVQLTVQSFGLQRSGKNVTGIVEDRIRNLLADGDLVSQDGVLSTPSLD